jgi:hypothetical protein
MAMLVDVMADENNAAHQPWLFSSDGEEEEERGMKCRV